MAEEGKTAALSLLNELNNNPNKEEFAAQYVPEDDMLQPYINSALTYLKNNGYNPQQIDIAKRAAAMQRSYEKALKLPENETAKVQQMNVEEGQQYLLKRTHKMLNDLHSRPEYMPALDPRSEIFDKSQYALAAEINSKARLMAQFASTLKGNAQRKQILDPYSNTISEKEFENGLLQRGLKAILMNPFQELATQINAQLLTQEAISKDIAQIEPLINEELAKEKVKDPAFKYDNIYKLMATVTPLELMQAFGYDVGIKITSAEGKDLQRILKAARKRINIKGSSPDKINYPLDKLNRYIWTGQDLPRELDVGTQKRGSKQETSVLFTIDFDALDQYIELSKTLTAFDKRVYIAVSAIYQYTGNDVMSVGQIYRAMGGINQLNEQYKQKIYKSLTKMLTTRISVNNNKEREVYKNYPQFVYDGALLPFERVTAYINGALVESAIHIFRYPPLIDFAKGRKQITTIDRQLLESPINKTESNLRLENYLLETIAGMKNNRKLSRKMLYSKIYSKCDISTKKQKQRAPEKIKRYLNHYKTCEWIKGYKESNERDGIEISL